ncbi:unnamed protein product [Effrenium voratum]|nr:unnamed protein product [Effrenium voratum]
MGKSIAGILRDGYIDLLFRPSHWLFKLLFLAVLCATMLSSTCVLCEGEDRSSPCERPIKARAQVPQLGLLQGPSDAINHVVMTTGPIWPFLVLLLQVAGRCGVDLLPPTWRSKEKDGAANGCAECMQLLGLFLFITLTRLVMFLGMRHIHYYVSDHIFLVHSLPRNSMLAQLEMSLALPGSSLLVRLVAWALGFCFLFEAFITAWFYHTVFASWMGLITSTLLFQSICVYWCESWKEPDESADSDTYKELSGK